VAKKTFLIPHVKKLKLTGETNWVGNLILAQSSAIILPMAQTSERLSRTPFICRISGAEYASLPKLTAEVSPFRKNLASPRSMITARWVWCSTWNGTREVSFYPHVLGNKQIKLDLFIYLVYTTMCRLSAETFESLQSKVTDFNINSNIAHWILQKNIRSNTQDKWNLVKNLVKLKK